MRPSSLRCQPHCHAVSLQSPALVPITSAFPIAQTWRVLRQTWGLICHSKPYTWQAMITQLAISTFSSIWPRLRFILEYHCTAVALVLFIPSGPGKVLLYASRHGVFQFSARKYTQSCMILHSFAKSLMLHFAVDNSTLWYNISQFILHSRSIIS